MKRVLPLVLVVPLIVAAAVVVRFLGQWISGPDPVRHVDAIVVTSGEPDRRVPVALDMVERGVSAHVWVMLWTHGPVVNERERISAYAAARGTERTLEFIGESHSVLQEARMLRASIRHAAQRPRHIGVVAAPWQIARVRVAFQRTLGIDVSVWSDGSPYDARRWYRTNRVTTALEAVKAGATLAVLGPLPASRGQRPPATLPLRAMAGAFVAAAAVGAVCRRLARRLGLVSVPRLWRASARPTPMLGGLAILAGIGAGVVAAGGIHLGGLGLVAAAGVLVLALVGFVDDVASLGPRTRLMWAAVAGVVAWLLGLRIDVLGAGHVADVFDGVLTILWFVGVTHALNVLDHVDGATAAVGAASAATIAAVAAVGGQYVVAAAAAAVAGACLGYLVHNFPPARLFMGDMGALALGFALASLALGLTPHQRVPLSAAVAVLALGVPIFDTTLVTISRIRCGRSPLVGGTDHVSHRMLQRGYSLRATIGVLASTQVALGLVAYAVAVAPRAVGWLLVVAAAAAGVAALGLILRWDEWTPPAHGEMSGEVRAALGRAMDALLLFVEAAEASGLAGSDPATIRAVSETARRLGVIGGRFSAPDGAAVRGGEA